MPLTKKKFYGMVSNVLIGLACVIALMVFIGNSLPPRVLQVSIGTQINPLIDRQIFVMFSHAMEHHSVETNFNISPNVSGKFSWIGKKMVFTPDEIFPYDSHFTLTLGKDTIDQDGAILGKDFVQSFSTSPLRFAYIGVDGDEAGRLVISDFSAQNRKVLTDKDLHIESFKIAPDGNTAYVFGYKETSYTNHLNELYSINLSSGETHQITNDRGFINKSFTLSPDGNTIALARLEVSPDGVYLTRIQNWLASTKDFRFTKFLNGRAEGSNVFFTPDGSSLLYKNPDSNYEFSPLEAINKDQASFVGAFDSSYGFHSFKPMIAFMKNDNSDLFSMKNSLILFNGEGEQQTVPFPKGLARDTIFTEDGKSLISIFSKPEEAFNDKDSNYPLRIFHLYSYNLDSEKIQQLTSDFDYSEEDPAISPDSRYLLFERYETFSNDLVIDPAYRDVADSLSSIMKGGELWRLNLSDHTLEDLHVKGTKLTFLP